MFWCGRKSSHDVAPESSGEKSFQHLGFFFGTGPQQSEKIALRKYYDLGELRTVQVQKFLCTASHSAFAAAFQQAHLPVFIYEAFVGFPRLQLFCVPVDMQEPAAAEPVNFSLQGKIEFYGGGNVLRGAGAAHAGKISAPPCGAAVECKAHGIQQSGFPAARGTGNEKQGVLPKKGEIQFSLFEIGAESL